MLFVALSHGDMLFIVDRITLDPAMTVDQLSVTPPSSTTPSSVTPSSSVPSTPRQRKQVQEDAVDVALGATDGKIHRKKDPQL